MNNEATIDKMKSLRLAGMMNSFQNMLTTGDIHDFKNEELIAHLIEAEYDERHNKRIKGLIKKAGFRMVTHIEEIKYDVTRNINKNQILKLSELNWINKGENIIIIASYRCGQEFFVMEILDKESRISLFELLY